VAILIGPVAVPRFTRSFETVVTFVRDGPPGSGVLPEMLRPPSADAHLEVLRLLGADAPPRVLKTPAQLHLQEEVHLSWHRFASRNNETPRRRCASRIRADPLSRCASRDERALWHGCPSMVSRSSRCRCIPYRLPNYIIVWMLSVLGLSFILFLL